jgi:hypothetical protein
MRDMNMQFSLKKIILLSVLLNGVIIGLSVALIIILSSLTINHNRFMGFFETGMIVLLPIAGIIAGFKIGDLYIFIYNTLAGLLNLHKIELNNQL